MVPCSLCNTDRRKEIITSTVTDRSQAPIKRSRLYERLSENLSFAKLPSAVISSSASAMFVGRSDYTERMKRLCAPEKRQDGLPHVGCVGAQDRCQSNRYAKPLEQGRADGVNESSLIANHDRRVSPFILPALGSIRAVFRITSRRVFSEEKIICP